MWKCKGRPQISTESINAQGEELGKSWGRPLVLEELGTPLEELGTPFSFAVLVKSWGRPLVLQF